MKKQLLRLAPGLLLLFLTACASSSLTATTQSPTGSPTKTPVSPTATSAEPFPTPVPTQIPLMRPNGGVYLGDYDPVSKKVLMTGLGSADVWGYDAAANQFTRYKDRPAEYNINSLIYEPTTSHMLAYRTSQGKFWEFDPVNDTWVERPSQNDAFFGDFDPSFGLPLAYDSESKKVVVFGNGGDSNSLLMIYDLASNTWAKMKPENMPTFAHTRASLAYDTKADRMLIWEYNPTPSVWAYDDNQDAWEQHLTSGGPKDPGGGYAILYDPDLDRTFVLYNDQFYSYDLNTNLWEKAKGDFLPPNRIWPVMVYDSNLHKIVLYGGQDYTGMNNLNDLWTYDPATGEWLEQKLP